jgi:hypothetical protein
MSMIVRYLMNGTFRATRHADGCGILRRALREQDAAQCRRWKGGGYEALLVMTESEYASTGGREPKDCRCVQKALAEVRS